MKNRTALEEDTIRVHFLLLGSQEFRKRQVKVVTN